MLPHPLYENRRRTHALETCKGQFKEVVRNQLAAARNRSAHDASSRRCFPRKFRKNHKKPAVAPESRGGQVAMQEDYMRPGRKRLISGNSTSRAMMITSATRNQLVPRKMRDSDTVSPTTDLTT